MAEDEGFGDITTALLPNIDGSANVITHEDGVIAGLSEAESIFAHYNLVTAPLCCDGDVIKKDDTVLRVIGPVRGILVTERVAAQLPVPHERHCHDHAPLCGSCWNGDDCRDPEDDAGLQTL